jgi:hypothetical protein
LEYKIKHKCLCSTPKLFNQGCNSDSGVGAGDDWGNDDDDDFFGGGGGDGDSVDECDITKDNMAPFGLFMGRNLTHLDPREEYTGKEPKWK